MKLLKKRKRAARVTELRRAVCPRCKLYRLMFCVPALGEYANRELCYDCGMAVLSAGGKGKKAA